MEPNTNIIVIENIQKQPSKHQKKCINLSFKLSILFVSVALLIIFVVSIWQFSSTGYLLNNAIVSGSAFILLQVSTLVIIFIQSKLSVKAFKLSIITFITIFAGFSVGTFISLIVSFSLGIVYGPISFIHEDKTRIHWAKRTGPYFRSRLYNASNFTYNFNDRQYTNLLPSKTSKFIVMADIHLNNHYTSTMSTDYDFALFCGDYSFHGKLQEYSLAFNKMPTKSLLMAVGNHDDRRNFSLVNGRSKNFFQKVNQIGFYFIHVQILNPIIDSEVDNGIQFILNNSNLGMECEHNFIVVHFPVYSTGDLGSHKYFSERIEQLISNHAELKIRATFSGHDHIFSAYCKNNVYNFINGAGGGKIDQMTNAKKYGNRTWSGNEIHGKQKIVSDNCYGYDLHA
ncbi:Calcineurin-like_phosphoesterase superfamily domain-containing protein [Hexamita inflata]|uniref:Calcineurin-like phosphoesterase superfamily domain-containing protein n=1 Tax=Hexamita inflata TaxID=28002 RepID=A0AA86QF82_9EUKA|nr:Calcineurin-like phosphoesterase superfamily domain-containing protein [Hexamita inflata]